MSQSLTCDDCGAVADQRFTSYWLHVSGARDGIMVSFGGPKLNGDYCSAGCLAARLDRYLTSEADTRMGEPLTEYELAVSTIRGRLEMAKAALESAQGAYNDAIAEGRDVDAVNPRRTRRPRRSGTPPVRLT